MDLRKLKKLGKKLKQKLPQCNKRQVLAGLAALAILAALGHGDGKLRPSTTAEYASASVMITNFAQNSGGSGVILSSSPTESIILTNRHVCGVVDHGGYVITDTAKYPVQAVKKAESHDLCEIKVNADLHVNTAVAEHAPKLYSKAHVSGHPRLMPHVLTEGAFSGRSRIEIMTGMRECSKEEMEQNPLQCILGGGYPVVESYDSQVVTATILPGSSGSPVYDENGEIAGLVFASSSRELSYAYIVPQEYVSQFVRNEAPKMEWKKPGAPALDNAEESHSRSISI